MNEIIIDAVLLAILLVGVTCFVAGVRQQILLNTLRALGTFNREQVGPEFGALLIGGLIEKVGKDQYQVK